MRKNRWFLRMLGLMLVSALLMTAALATTPGTNDDPLVTLSYLKEVFAKDMLSDVDEKIDQRNAQIIQELSGQMSGGEAGSADTFAVVTLTKGQVLTGDIGCEVMLRIGTASRVTPSNPGLIDETTAETLSNGKALVVNHLYMMTIEGRGVKATADTTKLMVRGTYTIA